MTAADGRATTGMVDTACEAWEEFWPGRITTPRHREALEYVVNAVFAKLGDPNAVHINMLTGTVAKPTIAQIIHIYGREALRAALAERDVAG